MSWEDILKRSIVRNFQLEEQSDEFIENMKDKYLGYIAPKSSYQSNYGIWILLPFALGDSRQEVFDVMKRDFMEQGNRPGNTWGWTMEGNLYQGDAVIYDGAMLVLGKPTYWYYIADGLDDIPPSNPEQEIRVDRHNPDRVMDRIEGKEFDSEEGELPSDFKDENR